MTPDLAEDDHDGDADPRRLRSRARLLAAATHLLSVGGIEAVTIEAVTQASQVARTTLYRHFSSSTELLAAAFEELLPPVTPPPATGPLRERLIEALSRQATLLEDTHLRLTMMAWLALGPLDAAPDDADEAARSISALRSRVSDDFRVPFDQILQSPEARAELDEFDPILAFAQLVGPLVFSRLSGLRAIQHSDCVRIVDDFLVAHRHRHDARAAEGTPGPPEPLGDALTGLGRLGAPTPSLDSRSRKP